LGSGIEIKENDTLPCGIHTIQTMVTDDAGNINVCEFQVYVNCEEWGEDMITGEYFLNGRMILASQIENKESFPDFVRLGTGSLSAIWESGKRGPGVISKGKGDPGGVSYGIYQLSLKKGYVERFIENEGQLYSSLFGEHKAGTRQFNKMWKTVAEIDPTGFAQAQHDFIERTHFNTYAKRVKNQVGLDVLDYSPVIKDVMWSTAVQHGPYNNVFKNALAGQDLEWVSEEEIIERVYAERGKTKEGKLIYFPRVGEHWKRNLIQRFEGEKRVALSRLESFYEYNPLIALVNKNKIKNKPRPVNFAPTSEEIAQPSNFVQQADHEEGDTHEVNRDPKIVLTGLHDEKIEDKKLGIEPRENTPVENIPEKNVVESDEEVSSIESGISAPLLDEPSETKEIKETYRILFVILRDDRKSFPGMEQLGTVFQERVGSTDQVRYMLGDIESLEMSYLKLAEVKAQGYGAAMIVKYRNNRLVDYID
jgi:hypothetical protein